MNLDEFIVKWTGKGIDFDFSYGFQCQDLYRMYVKEVLGFPQSPSVPGAKDNWDKYLKEYFDRIPNSPTGVPVKGDIMIWGASYGPYGHVAVVTEATVNTFKCFSQNDPTGSLPAIRWYKNYTGTLGWLHPREVDTSDNIDQLKKDLAEQQQQVRNYVEQVTGLKTDLDKRDKLIEEIQGELKTANETTSGYLKEIKTAKESLSTTFDCKPEWVEINAKATEAVGFIDKADELDRKLSLEQKEHQADVESFGKEIAGLKTQLASLESKYKALKDTQNTPIQTSNKRSIIDIIKKILGV